MAPTRAHHPIIFASGSASQRERRQAVRLIESLRTFGGAYRSAPFWLFDSVVQEWQESTSALPNVEIIPLATPPALADAILANKVCACAQAEGRARGAFDALVWVNPECLFLQPPALLDLRGDADIALRPVHLRNVGAPATAPLDAYWRTIYATVGLEITGAEVESFVDGQRIHPYFNTHLFAIDPSLGLCGRWLHDFAALLNDDAFQSGACADGLHRLFLHQAILSALLLAAIPPARRRILPPAYGYPYDLHDRIPPARRAHSLDELVCVVVEERSLDPAAIHDLAVSAALRGWLANQVG